MAGAEAANGRNKYAVLDPSDEPEGRRRPSAWERRSKERFVLACAIFASLNAILLGYGEFLQCRWRAPLPVPGDPSLRIRTAHFSCKFVRP